MYPLQTTCTLDRVSSDSFYTQHTATCLVLRPLPYLLLLSLLSSFLHSLVTLSLPCLPSISVSCLATPLYFLPSIQGRQHTKAPMEVLPCNLLSLSPLLKRIAEGSK